MNKQLIGSLIISVLIIGVAIVVVGKRDDGQVPVSNVTVEGGVQIVTIDARGGYSPRYSVATSGLPTIIRFTTAGTFDCSLAVSIPTLGVRRMLPSSGTTDVAIGTSTLGMLSGSCSMGMYPFSVEFK